jgi:nucleolar protein 53
LQTKRALVGGGWRAGADLWRNVVGGEGEENAGQDAECQEESTAADAGGADGASSSSDAVAARKPPRPKTAKERRRAAAAAALQAQQKAAKEAKKAANMAAQINPKKIAKEESDKKRIAEVRRQAKEQRKMDLGRRLGPQRMDIETPAVLLTEDIPQSFGRLKATVNPFEDRLRSLQERNLVEYRKPTKMRARYDMGTYVQRTGPKRCGCSAWRVRIS